MVIANQVYEGPDNLDLRPKLKDKFRFATGHVGFIVDISIGFAYVESQYGWSRFELTTLEACGSYQGVIVWQLKEDS